MKPVIRTGSKILCIDEAPTIQDLQRQEPFSGASSNGAELARMLHEAGILKTECSLACVSRRPKFKNDTKGFFQKKTPQQWIPDAILMQDIEKIWEVIERVRPNLIIAFGDLSLWAVSGHRSVAKWRGSVIDSAPALPGIVQSRPYKVVPTYSPTQIIRMWPWRHIAVQDLKRCNRESLFPENKIPPYTFHIRPTYAEAIEYLDELKDECDKNPGLKVSCDIETIAHQIACVGYGTTRLEAMCIPILTKDDKEGYWSPQEEMEIVSRQRKILGHETADVFGQNFLYDAQYFIRYWGVRPKIRFDTMVAWHTLYPGEKKSLDYIASMLCGHYTYWKDELKDYKNYPLDEETFWKYNCKDIVYTYECRENLDKLLEHNKLMEQFKFQMEMHEPVLQMMLRGVLIDTQYKSKLGMELFDLSAEYHTHFNKMLAPDAMWTKKGQSAWYDSPTQLARLLYTQCKLPVQRQKKTYRPTTDDVALEKLKSKEPALSKLFRMLQEYRSIGVFQKNFVATPLESNRMHCSFSIAGPETFRFSSSSDAFGYGTNLQNIPSGTEDK
jgi:uracil-DNA glycosylase